VAETLLRQIEAEIALHNGDVEPHTIRVTHVYRRENGEWKIVHSHRDELEIRDLPR
jgi:ketosteroid isomerase-like protein